MTNMAVTVYILCTLTSLMCSVLLFRSYFRTHVRLVFWSALCFTGLTLNNFAVFMDLIVFPETDLALYRLIPTLIALWILIFGLIWDTV